MIPPELSLSNLVCGYSTSRHLILDLDGIDTYKTVRLVRLLQLDYTDLGCALVLRSSRNGRHVVFDEYVGWDRILSITDTLSALHLLNYGYQFLRLWRGDLTLRVSPKQGTRLAERSPRPLDLLHSRRGCCHLHGIRGYLEVLKAFSPELQSIETITYPVNPVS